MDNIPVGRNGSGVGQVLVSLAAVSAWLAEAEDCCLIVLAESFFLYLSL